MAPTARTSASSRIRSATASVSVFTTPRMATTSDRENSAVRMPSVLSFASVISAACSSRLSRVAAGYCASVAASVARTVSSGWWRLGTWSRGSAEDVRKASQALSPGREELRY